MSSLLMVLFLTFVIALLFGALLGLASVKLKVEGNPIIDEIDAILPQSQCGQCGYPGCKPYAEAVANGEAITKCIPGGQAVVEKIALLLGVEAPQGDFSEEDPAPKIAFIDENMCIGCTKCLQVCPVDAIIGTNKSVHTVIPDLCTGCNLCLTPCPTECISMQPIESSIKNWDWQFEQIPVRNIQENDAEGKK